jgi:hypothetical protein
MYLDGGSMMVYTNILRSPIPSMLINKILLDYKVILEKEIENLKLEL